MFAEKLKKAMETLGINQKQLCAITGIGKSSISQYLSGRNEPTADRQKKIALALGLKGNYFDPYGEYPKLKTYGKIKSLMVADAAKLLGMNANTVRKGLQQGVFPWGYAIKTSENRWTYFINAKSFVAIEHLEDELRV